MTRRDQLLQERLDALLDLLEDRGVLDHEENRALSNTRDLGEAPEFVQDRRQK